METKKQKINYETPHSADCRIGLKVAVIQTSEHGRAWLAAHMGVFMNHLMNVTVGNGLYEMHLNDFDDILLTREIDIWSVPPEKIVDVIIHQIDENKYVMIDLYVRKQFPDGGGNDIQSWLIYGYDKI